MPKQKGMFPLRGKMGDKVFYSLPDGETGVRNVAAPGSKKDEPALKEQYVRAPFLNKLAAGISNIVKMESDNSMSGKFYAEMLSRFRKLPSDNRFLLLSSLKGLNIHPIYTFEKVPGDEKVTITPGDEMFTVDLKVTWQPMMNNETNCYCYQFILMQWNDAAASPTFERQYSEWIYLEDPKTLFEFTFKRDPGVVHWMLFEMKQMGLNDEAISLKQQGMRIAEVGTFIEDEVALLEEYEAEQKKKIAASARRKDEIVRVKAKE